MTATRALSAVLLAAGALLLYVGRQEQQRLGNQVAELFTGEPTRDVSMYYAAGAACLVIGVIGLVMGGRKR